MTTVNRMGARGHPCLMDLWISTAGVTRPGILVFMLIVVPCRLFTTKSMKELGAPISISACCILDHLTVGYAFEMS